MKQESLISEYILETLLCRNPYEMKLCNEKFITFYSGLLISNVHFGARAKEISIAEIKGKVDFKALLPKRIPINWSLEIKTYPWREKDFRLHYIEKEDKYLMIGIEERKASERKIKKKQNAEEIIINGNIGYFQEWADSSKLDNNGHLITGGILTWIQEGTYIEMDSSNVDKDKIIEIARSMK